MIIFYYVLFFSFIFMSCKAATYGQKPTTLFNKGSCECEKSNKFVPRIVGGKDAEPHEYPWMAAIFNNGLLFCGGSLINDRYIITAGHCFIWFEPDQISVTLGLHDRVLYETFMRGGKPVEIEDIIVHEKFSSNKYHDSEDIALIKLKNPVTFTEKIRPICLPSNPDNNYTNRIGQIVGWGKITTDGARSRLLKQANVTIISYRDCKKIPQIGKYIQKSMLCAYKYKVDACQGDSGGPLFYETRAGRIELVGIVSWGIGCAEPGIPGVYTKVTSYLDWIASHTQDATYCKSRS